jgi:hypothetical protein
MAPSLLAAKERVLRLDILLHRVTDHPGDGNLLFLGDLL